MPTIRNHTAALFVAALLSTVSACKRDTSTPSLLPASNPDSTKPAWSRTTYFSGEKIWLAKVYGAPSGQNEYRRWQDTFLVFETATLVSIRHYSEDSVNNINQRQLEPYGTYAPSATGTYPASYRSIDGLFRLQADSLFFGAAYASPDYLNSMTFSGKSYK